MPDTFFVKNRTANNIVNPYELILRNNGENANLLNGLVGAWSPAASANTGGKLLDLSGYGNNGTLTNMDPATDWVNANINGRSVQALDFDGTDDYVKFSNAFYQMPFSVSAWALARNTTTAHTIFGIGNSSTPNQLFNVSFRGDQANDPITAGMRGIDGATNTWSSFDNYQANTWYHIAAVFYGASDRLVFVNGISGTRDTTTHTIEPLNQMSLGVLLRTSPVVYLNGQITDVLQYNRALSPSEIRQLYQLGPGWLAQPSQPTKRTSVFYIASPPPPPPTTPITVIKQPKLIDWTFDSSVVDNLRQGLVGAWSPADTGPTGYTLYDLSGNNNHGTLTNMDPATDWVGANVNGRAVQALDFDGINDYVLLDNNLKPKLTGINRLTLSSWVLYNSFKTDGSPIFNWPTTETSANPPFNIISLGVDQNGNVYFIIGDGTTRNFLTTTTSPVKLNKWAHVVGTWDGATLRAFVNGVVSDTTLPSTISSIGTASPQIRIGAYNSGNPYLAQYALQGRIVNSTIYNRALSPSEIRQLYQLGPGWLARSTQSTSSTKRTSLFFIPAPVPPPQNVVILRKQRVGVGQELNPLLSENWDTANTLRQGLVGAWCPSLTGNTGGKLMDLSGYGNNGALMNMDPATDWVASGGKMALDFDGTDDYVNIGGMSQINNASKATIAGWLYRSSTSHTPCFGFVNGNSSGPKRFSVIWWNDGSLFVACENDSTPCFASTTFSGVGLIHVSLVFDGSGTTSDDRLKLFINGNSKTLSFGASVPTALGTVTPFAIGKDSSNRFGVGRVDDVRVYNRALTPAEIQQLYAGGRGYGLTKQTKTIYFTYPIKKINLAVIPSAKKVFGLSTKNNPLVQANYSASTLRQGLVGAWCPSLTANTGGKLLDLSGRGNDGVLTNMDPATDWVTSGGTMTLDFDDNNDYVALATSKRFQPEAGESFTIAAWVRPTSSTTEKIIFSHGANGPTFYLGYSGGQFLEFAKSNVANTGQSVSTTPISAATWQHVACTVTVNSDVQLFVNGVQKSSVAFNYTFSYAKQLRIGSGDGDIYVLNSFGGQINDVRYYTRKLSKSELSLLYTGGPGYGLLGESEKLIIPIDPPKEVKINLAVIPSAKKIFGLSTKNNPLMQANYSASTLRQGLVGAWCPSLTGNTQGKLLDLSGYRNDGSLTYMDLQNSWRPINGGTNLQFDGNDDYVSFSTSRLPVGNVPFTFSAWINWFGDGINNTDFIISYGYDNAVHAIPLLALAADGKIEFSFGSSQGKVLSNSIIQTSKWYHVVGVYNGSQTKIYISGNLENTTAYSSANIRRDRNTADAAYLGAIGAAFSFYGNVGSGNDKRYGTFNGQIDDVRIYNRALTDAEVRALYTGGRGYGLLGETERLVIPIDTPRIIKIDIAIIPLVKKVFGLSTKNNPLMQANYSASTLRQGLVGAWCASLTGNTGGKLLDLSGRGNNGVLTNMDPATDWVNANIKGKNSIALDFDGVNDYVKLSNYKFSTMNQLSVSVWVNATSDGSILSNQIALVRYANVELNTDGFITNPIDVVPTTKTASFTSIAGQGWKHVVGSWDGTRNRAYINGVLAGGPTSQNQALSAAQDAALVVGLRNNNGANYQNMMAGQVADVRIYNRALTPNEIQQLYTGGPGYGLLSETERLVVPLIPKIVQIAVINTQATKRVFGLGTRNNPLMAQNISSSTLRRGLLGAWCPGLTGNTGGKLLDLSGYRNDGALTNMDQNASWTISGGKSALSFDGINDFVNFGTASSINFGSMRSVSFWFLARNVAENFTQHTFTMWDLVGGVNQRTIVHQINPSSGKLSQYWSPDGTADSTAISTPVLTNSTWYHVVSVFRNGVRELWLNGNLVGSLSQASIYTGATTSRLAFAAIAGRASDTPVATLNGQGDDIRIYNRALTDAEIRALYTGGRGVGLTSESEKLVIPIDAPKPYVGVTYDASAVFVNMININQTGNLVFNADPLPQTIVMPSRRLKTNLGLSGEVYDENTVLRRGLIGAWSPAATGPTGGKLYDLSGKGNHGVLTNMDLTTTSGWTNASVNGSSITALSFDGVNDTIVAKTLSNLTTTFTSCAWINPKVLPQLGMVVTNGQDNGSNFFNGWSWGIASGGSSSSQLTGLAAGIAWVGSGYSFPTANKWYFVAITKNDLTWEFWVNGLLVGTGSSNVSIPSTTFFISGQNGVRYFNGNIIDVLAYDRALSPSEIRQLYQLGPGWLARSNKLQVKTTTAKTVPVLTQFNSKAEVVNTGNLIFNADPLPQTIIIPSRRLKTNLGLSGETYDENTVLRRGLIGAWSPAATGPTGGKLYDLSGNNNHGTLTNMDPATDWVGANVNGRAVQALDFDGVNDYVLTTKTFQNAPVTAYVFCNARANGSYVGLFFQRPIATGINLSPSGVNVGYTWNDDKYNWEGGPTFPLNVNCLIAITIFPSYATAYAIYNNTIYSGTNTSTHSSLTQLSNINIGRDSFGTARVFNGTIYEAGLFSRGLSSQELFKLYQLGPGWLAKLNKPIKTTTVKTVPVLAQFDSKAETASQPNLRVNSNQNLQSVVTVGAFANQNHSVSVDVSSQALMGGESYIATFRLITFAAIGNQVYFMGNKIFAAPPVNTDIYVVASRRAKTNIGLNAQNYTENTVLRQGLVGAWSPATTGYTGGKLIDLSGYGNNGKLINTDTSDQWINASVNGKVLTGLNFNGVNNFISFPSTQLHKPSTLSVVSWIKIPNTPNIDYKAFMLWSGGSFDTWTIQLKNSGTAANIGILFTSYLSGNINSILYNTLNFNPYYFVVGTIGSEGTKFYVNGTLIGTGNNTSVTYGAFGSQSLRIGENDATYSPGRFLDFILYNRQLSQSEILNLYSLGPGWLAKSDKLEVKPIRAVVPPPPPPPPKTQITLITSRKSKTNLGIGWDSYTSSSSLRQGLVGAWCPSLTGNTGGKLLDLSGYGNHGALTNMDPPNDWVTSGGSMALDFDGVDDYCQISGGTIFATKNRPFCASLWALVKSYDATHLYQKFLMLKSDANNAFEIGMAQGDSQYNGVLIGDNGTFYRSRTGLETVQIGTFRHCVVVYNGAGANVKSNYQIYINGVSQSLLDAGGFASTSNSTSLTYNTLYNRLNGQLDDVRIYNRFLSPSEIQLLYTGGRGFGLIPENKIITPITTTL